MNEKNIKIYVVIMIVVSLFLSFYLVTKNIHLSIILFSGSIFSLFLLKNPKLLLCKSIKEIDDLIPVLQGKSYFYGSFIVLIFNFIFL